MGGTEFQFPDEDTFLEELALVPDQAFPEDGYWSYTVTDSNSVTLRLSFDIFERSIQTVLSVSGKIISTVVQEGATNLRVVCAGGERRIYGQFKFRNASASLIIALDPVISLTWSTMVNSD